MLGTLEAESQLLPVKASGKKNQPEITRHRAVLYVHCLSLFICKMGMIIAELAS